MNYLRWIAAVCVFSVLFDGWIAEPTFAQKVSQSPTSTVKASPDELGIQSLAKHLDAWLNCLQGESSQFGIEGRIWVLVDQKPHQVDLRLNRFDDQSFDLILNHEQYAMWLIRRDDMSAMVLPKHRAVILGKGECDEQDHLQPQGALTRLIGSGSSVLTYFSMIRHSDALTLAETMAGLLHLKSDVSAESWKSNDPFPFRLVATDSTLEVSVDGHRMEWRLHRTPGVPLTENAWEGFQPIQVTRKELERTIARGVRRGLEILVPSPRLTQPKMEDRQVEHGKLHWVDGQRLVSLWGKPDQIGTAHGQLLRDEAMRCIDSVLHSFGTVQTIVTGKWFRQELDVAYSKLAAHIPERHQRETTALAKSLDLDPHLLQTVNVFPELFHCSGFAVFGKATADGKLYHGRVLDYMTAIGLQDASSIFVVQPDERIPFVNVGYAGFIGSVSGMNSAQVSLGEMGGRGEGNWNGVPMATLMRRALEECNSLEEVMNLWQKSPRTCEYFYVFADGKIKTAVGVGATPEKVEFVFPGQSHALLGDGIQDAIVLSAGDRLETLRSRVKEKYGTIDADVGQWLMSRPVAMTSNLHNVLFVPEDDLLFVANADHQKIAAERPYVRLAWKEYLTHSKIADKKLAVSMDRLLPALDTLQPKSDSDASARLCIDGLCWQPTQFQVQLEPSVNFEGDCLVRFPSPMDTRNPTNDSVAMEWYQAKNADGNPVTAPAVVVVHESGSGMKVGRLIARGLRAQGLHAFMVQLPHYGVRRSANEEKPVGKNFVNALRQSVMDVRRAKDAVASIALVDPESISLQGTSLGGFVAATTAGMDQAYKNVFLLLAGGGLHDVLNHGTNDAAKVRLLLEQGGLNREEIKELLDTVEPLRLAHRLDPERTWLFSGQFDDVVPPRNSDLLAQAARLDDKHHIRMLANHYSGIVFLPIVLTQIGRQVRLP